MPGWESYYGFHLPLGEPIPSRPKAMPRFAARLADLLGNVSFAFRFHTGGELQRRPVRADMNAFWHEEGPEHIYRKLGQTLVDIGLPPLPPYPARAPSKVEASAVQTQGSVLNVLGWFRKSAKPPKTTAAERMREREQRAAAAFCQLQMWLHEQQEHFFRAVDEWAKRAEPRAPEKTTELTGMVTLHAGEHWLRRLTNANLTMQVTEDGQRALLEVNDPERRMQIRVSLGHQAGNIPGDTLSSYLAGIDIRFDRNGLQIDSHRISSPGDNSAGQSDLPE